MSGSHSRDYARLPFLPAANKPVRFRYKLNARFDCQAEGGDVWREVVRDGARSGGGETGPNPQSLRDRLDGLRADPKREIEAEQVVEPLASDAPPVDGGEAMLEEGREGGSEGDLRLDGPGDVPRVPEGSLGSPMREPPKTPKRNKASSPQLSDVRGSKECLV